MRLADYLLHVEGLELPLSAPSTGALPCGHVGGSLHFGLAVTDLATVRGLEGKRMALSSGITRRPLGWLEIKHVDESHRLLSADLFASPADSAH